MASLQTLERRILALEARLAEIEGGYGDTLYKLHRASVKTDLRLAKMLDHLNPFLDSGQPGQILGRGEDPV